MEGGKRGVAKGRRKRATDEEIANLYGTGRTIREVSSTLKTAQWRVVKVLRDRGMTRDISTAMLRDSDGWRVLNKSGTCVILSIPKGEYIKLGFSDKDDLLGRWIVQGNQLYLDVKRGAKEEGWNKLIKPKSGATRYISVSGERLKEAKLDTGDWLGRWTQIENRLWLEVKKEVY